MRTCSELKELIYTERIVDLAGLTPEEREVLKAHPALMQAVEENRALGALLPTGPAPAREAMLRETYRAVDDVEESRMTPITNLFSGKRWYVQATIAVVLLAVVATFWLVPQEASWAQMDGYMLLFDFGAVSSSDGDIMANPPMSTLSDALKQFKAEHFEEGDGAKLMLNAMVEDGNLTVTVSLTADADNLEVLQHELQEVLTATAGLPTPTVVPSTWFGDKDAPGFGCALDLDLNGHRFNFPDNATEEEIEAAIISWLESEHPGAEAEVDATIEQVGEEKKVMIRVMVKPPEGSEDES
jgi:hypothetical protein